MRKLDGCTRFGDGQTGDSQTLEVVYEVRCRAQSHAPTLASSASPHGVREPCQRYIDETSFAGHIMDEPEPRRHAVAFTAWRRVLVE